MPKVVKYAVVVFFMLTWKWTYYAVSTFSQLELIQYRKTNKVDPEVEKYHKAHGVNLFSLFTPSKLPPWFSCTKFFVKVLLPYVVGRFIVAPLPYYYLFGESGYKYALINLALADLVTNVHSFMVIVPNHAGNDMYQFTQPCKPRSGHFYLRQVLGSANFATGTDIVDFSQGWLNYQIEHHLFPDLSMRSYQKAQPLVVDLCKKHGVPYIQENVFIRVKKTVDIMVGNADMRDFPSQYY